MEHLRDQYRHCKPILALGSGAGLLQQARLALQLPDGSEDAGLVVGEGGDAAAMGRFMDALRQHRNFARETDPPRV